MKYHLTVNYYRKEWAEIKFVNLSLDECTLLIRLFLERFKIKDMKIEVN